MNNISQKLKELFVENNLIKSKFLFYIVVTIFALKIATTAIYLPISQNFFFADITKIDLVNLLNENRESLGIGTLKESATLNQVAMAKAQDMIKNGYFAHQSPSGLSPWFWFKSLGYIYKYAGENLAVGFADSKTVYDAWFNSPSHKANLLNSNYTEVGTAVVTGFQGNAILVVQEFGSPLIKTTPIATPQKLMPKVPKGTPAPKPAPVIQNPATETPAKTDTVKEVIPAADDTALVQNTPKSDNNTVTIPEQILGVSAKYVAPSDGLAKDTWYFRILNFVLYEYTAILESICWVLLILIAGLILFSIIQKIQLPNKILMLRSLVLVLILAVSILINKDLISQIISSHIII